MDYLEHERNIPHHQPVTKTERNTWVEQKKCKSCKHYDFYFCRIQNQNTAPDMNCNNPTELYSPSDMFKTHSQFKYDSEEETSVI